MLKIIEDRSSLEILIAFLVILVTIVIIWSLKQKKSKRKNYLILGPSNSGKTRLFCQLVYRKNVLTQISITANQAEAQIQDKKGKNKILNLVDIPGQDKVRRKFFSLFKKSTKAILFVVDSATFQKESKDVAQFLFEILTDNDLSKTRFNLLVVCNKQDVELSKGQGFIKTNLEKEIELLRRISSSALKSTSSSGESKSNFECLLKSANNSFEFSDLKYVNVEFCETSCLKYDDMESITKWLKSN